MVGQASPLLTARRAQALGALLVALGVWNAAAGALPDVSNAVDVALTALVLFPVTFAAVWLALPLAQTRGIGLVALATGASAVVLHLAGLGAGFEVAKLTALTLAGFWFLTLFEAVSWVAFVAIVIPWVDIASVYRGPTRVVIEEQPGLFDRISIGFRLPGEDDGARLGPPDVLFFALFLATASRFGLRVGWTWIGMTAGLSSTLVATYAFDLAGLPALPAIALGFVLPNADLLWRAVRGRAAAGDAPSEEGPG